MKRRKVRGIRVKPELKSFNCKSCGAPVEVSIIGQTLNVVCKNCKSIIDASDPSFRVLQEYSSKKTYEPYIPIGAKGKLKGKIWACTGFLVKSDSGYFWSEYLLFNPYHGYRWLVNVDGHWVLYKKIHRAVTGRSSSSAKYKSKKYKIFNSGQAEVEYVEGEFYWRVKRGDKAYTCDYIAPPSALSLEVLENEENWSLGHHIEVSTIQKAFGITKSPPSQKGVGQVQPSDIKEKLAKNSRALFFALIAIFAIHLLRVVSADNKTVYGKRIRISDAISTDSSKFFKTEPFKIEGRSSNIDFKVWADILNSWVYIDALLVDTSTQRGIPIPLEVSYYSGYDWSEGSRDGSKLVNNVPAGEYYLSIKTQAPSRYVDRFLNLKVVRDVPVHSGFFIVVILIILSPLMTLFSYFGFEKRRWSNSDFSPYEQG